MHCGRSDSINAQLRRLGSYLRLLLLLLVVYYYYYYNYY